MVRDLRNIPKLPENVKEQREEIKKLLTDEMYGGVGEYSFAYSSEKAFEAEIFKVHVKGADTHTFSFSLHVPKENVKSPAIVYLAFGQEDALPDFLTERGYAAVICKAFEIEADKADSFPQGLAKAICAKSAMAAWAEGMIIAAKIISEHERIDKDNIVAVGCSRLGKAALWAGALYEGFFAVASFDSGCGGAAINSGKQDEHITDMLKSFPHWFSPKMRKYIDNESAMPFDQHFLLALIAPRMLLVTSSTKDPYCDPYAEFLGLAYASRAYESYGKSGIGTFIRPPAGELLIGDGAAYYLRDGHHGVEREDWEALLNFLEE